MTRWIHISDLQLGLGKADNDESDELAADLIQAVLEQGPDFVIHSGDCTVRDEQTRPIPTASTPSCQSPCQQITIDTKYISM